MSAGFCGAFGSTTTRCSDRARWSYLALDLPSWEHVGNTAAHRRNIGRRPAVQSGLPRADGIAHPSVCLPRRRRAAIRFRVGACMPLIARSERGPYRTASRRLAAPFRRSWTTGDRAVDGRPMSPPACASASDERHTARSRPCHRRRSLLSTASVQRPRSRRPRSGRCPPPGSRSPPPETGPPTLPAAPRRAASSARRSDVPSPASAAERRRR